MSAIDDIMSQIPLSQLASQLGTDEQTAGAAVQQAIPALLSGMQANAQDPDGAASLEGALSNHSAGLIDGGVDLNQVDANDGQKIVQNIFGGHSDNVAQTLGGGLGGLGGLGGGNQGDLMKRLLPLLAPIVMSYLAKRMGGGGGAGGGLLGSLLGGALGGGALGGMGGGSAGGGIGDLLGSMLGGGGQSTQQQASSGNPMLDMLGGMLGAGRR